MFSVLLRQLVWGILCLRYRITIRGLEAIAAQGREKILFLPTHPALIDPVMVMAALFPLFKPHVIADQDGGVDHPAFQWLTKRFNVHSMPLMHKRGVAAKAAIERVIAERIAGLQHQENLLMYPAGRLMHSRYESLGANSAVETVLHAVPDVRVVLVRVHGLWGSRFGHAPTGQEPVFDKEVLAGLGIILRNLIFFTPKRPVTLEFIEATDVPRTADRTTINRYLETRYNAEPVTPNTYVPYFCWERGGMRVLPEPSIGDAGATAAEVPASVRTLVVEKLREMTGMAEVRDAQHLVHDLGLDSLTRAELLVWLGSEFGFPQEDTEGLQTVADVLLAAAGENAGVRQAPLAPVPATWFETVHEVRAAVPEAATVAEAFLMQARKTPDRPIVADQTSGMKTYRNLLTGILALLPSVRALPGETLGIMLPSSVAADIAYLTALFAGKTPVMVNWTVGTRNLCHGLALTGTQRVLTAKKLVSRIAAQGVDLHGVQDRFVYMEDLVAGLTLLTKLRAALGARTPWLALRGATISHIAAILFTSGSEHLPKAVPLTHTNLLSNLRSVLQVVSFFSSDRMLGMLPPFHSFGLTGNMLVSLCGGVPLVHHANPTEGALLARVIAAYRATVVLGTPTFLNGIARAATAAQLDTLRLAVTGAEACPPRVYTLLQERCPRAIIVEGYGVTECSPIVAANTPADPQPHTLGRPLPGVNVAIMDPDSGEVVTPGLPGMLLVRGASVFEGYLGSDAASPFVKHDGSYWYRTGDIVRQEADGTLVFVGRLTRFVKLGGEMISLPAIESVLQAEIEGAEDGPSIAVVAVGEAERPELVLFTTRALDRDAVNARLRDAGLSPLYFVRRVECVAAIPVLGTGKTDYRALQAMLVTV